MQHPRENIAHGVACRSHARTWTETIITTSRISATAAMMGHLSDILTAWSARGGFTWDLSWMLSGRLRDSANVPRAHDGHRA